MFHRRTLKKKILPESIYQSIHPTIHPSIYKHKKILAHAVLW